MNFSETFGSGPFAAVTSAHAKSGFDFSIPSSASSSPQTSSVTIDDDQLLFSGVYAREGGDLLISYEDRKVVIPDYFKGEARATLKSRDGATLTGDVVTALTGHTVYAQATAPEPPREIGTVQKLTGAANAIRNGVSVQLNVGDKVYKGDVLESGASSALGVSFVDGTVFNLSSNARMVLNEMVYDPSGSSNSSLLSLVQGTITFVAGQTAKNGNMRVDTPVATMGIRGTTVLVKINSTDGKVQLSVERDPDGKVGSFVVYDKTTGQVIGTVTREGDKTIISPAQQQGQQASTESVSKTYAEKVADLQLVQQVFQAFFPDVKKDPNNASPNRQGNNGSGSTDPRYAQLGNGAEKGTTEVKIPVVTGGAGGQTTSGPGSATVVSPPVVVSAFGDIQAPDAKASNFLIGGQVRPDPLIVPYIAGSAQLTKATTDAPIPNGFNLTGFVTIDTQTGRVSYNPDDFRFLAIGETASYEITFQAQTGPYIVTKTLPFTVDGLNDAPIYTAANFNAPVSEPLGTGSLTLFMKQGELKFTDADLSDIAAGYTVVTTGVTTLGEIRAIPNNATLLSFLHLDSVTKAIGTTQGSIKETFSAPAGTFDYLANGETVNIVYTVEVTDAHGATNNATLTVIITGTNDVPTITGATTVVTTSGAVAEDGTLVATGSITFQDVDLSDSHTASAVLSATALSSPLPGFNPATSQLVKFVVGVDTENTTDTGNIGRASWSYTLDNVLAQALAKNQVITQVYTVTITDVNGATVTQDVTVTVTGKNDGPIIEASAVPADLQTHTTVVAGAVTEDTGVVAGNLSAIGTIVFKDVDLIDTHTASVVLKSSDANADLPGFHEGVSPTADKIGTFLIGPLSELNTDTNDIGLLGWTFTLNDNDPTLQSLATGQTITQVYTITIVDNNGASVSQDVTIVINGANDSPDNNAPTIVATQTDAIGAVVEDASTTTLTDTGIITFQDIDLIDAHTIPASPLLPSSITVTSGGNAQSLPGFDPASEHIGTLTLTLNENTSDTDNLGTIGWAFSVADNDPRVQALAAGQVITQNYTVTIDDGHNGVATQIITVTITGVNDGPTIVAASTMPAGAVTEDAVAPNADLTVSGAITFQDIDLVDTHTATFVLTSSDATANLPGYSEVTPLSQIGAFALTPVTVAANGTVTESADTTSTATVGWTFTLPDSDPVLQSLAAGQIITQVYTVTITDNTNASVTQDVTVTITGTNDAPIVAATDVTGAVTELVTPAGNIFDTGTIAFTDVDLTDVHLVSAAGTPIGTTLGSLTAVKTTDTTGAGAGGLITWTYTVADSAVEYLAKDQTRVESFTITLDDQNGSVITRQIDVTITGTNDAPIVAATDVTGAVTELVTPAGNIFDTGTIAFTDVDLTDVHLVSAAGTPIGTTLGSLTAVKTTDTTGAGAGGLITWTYTVADSAVEYLAKDQTRVESFTITLDDQNGSVITRQIDVTITGTNDAPIVAATDVTGAVTELVTPAGNIFDTGTIAFTDVDLTDVHLVSAAGTPIGTTLGSLTAVKTTDTTGAGAGGLITWTYTVADSAVEYLAKDQTRVESFTITLDDQNGSVITRQIDVTITGTNDAPIVAATDVTGAVTELVTPAGNIFDTGTIAFTDVDLTDVHLVSAAGTPIGTTLGSLTAVKTTDTTGAGAGGLITWTYTVADSAVEYLAKDQTRVESFTITLDDQNGSVITRQIDVTITGTNDAPVVNAIAQQDLTEQTDTSALTATIPVTFGDVDLTDIGHTASVTAVAASGVTTGLGLNDADLIALVTPGTVTKASGASVGSVDLAFSAGSTAFDYLAVGQKLTLTYTVAIDDHDGGATPHTFVVTITGTNDLPQFVAKTGDTQSVTISDTAGVTGDKSFIGHYHFTDVDLADTHGGSGSLLASTNATVLGSFGGATNSEPAGTNPGDAIWSYSILGAKLDALGEGQTVTETANLIVLDGSGQSSIPVTITLVGVNDTPTVTSASLTVTEGGTAAITAADIGVTDPDNTSFTFSVSGVTHGVFQTTANGIDWVSATSFTSADLAADHVRFVHDGGEDAPAFSIQADDGSLLHNLSNVFGGSVTFTPVNDAPVITSAAQSASVFALGTSYVTGQLAATDPDAGDSKTWTADGGTRVSAPVYHFAIDEFKVTKNAFTLFDDTFNGTTPPASPAQNPATNVNGLIYIAFPSNAGFANQSGETLLDSDHAQFAGLSLAAANYGAPVFGQFATLSTNIAPGDSGGLRAQHAFTVDGTFDLLAPDMGEAYGLRLADRSVFGAMSQPGKDVVELAVVYSGGAAAVQFSELDFVTGTFSVLQTIALGTISSGDKILLDLSHTTADSLHIGASFAVVHGGVTGTWQQFTSTASIFTDSDWTRAQFFARGVAEASTAATADSVHAGTYGTLDVDQSGKWTYQLDQALAATHALASGETAHDVFTVSVTDSASASATTTIDVLVTGVNDAPVLNADNVSLSSGHSLTGMTLIDPDNGDQFTATATALYGSVTPSSSQGSAQAINTAFQTGLDYTPSATNASPSGVETVTLTVVDTAGLSDQVNFVFKQTGIGGSLTGTNGNDVIFSTDGADTLTGLLGRDNFVFVAGNAQAPNDTITDFALGTDKIVLNGFGNVFGGDFAAWASTHAIAQNSGADTLLALDVNDPTHNAILLQNVQKAALHASDFILHA